MWVLCCLCVLPSHNSRNAFRLDREKVRSSKTRENKNSNRIDAEGRDPFGVLKPKAVTTTKKKGHTHTHARACAYHTQKTNAWDQTQDRDVKRTSLQGTRENVARGPTTATTATTIKKFIAFNTHIHIHTRTVSHISFRAFRTKWTNCGKRTEVLR